MEELTALSVTIADQIKNSDYYENYIYYKNKLDQNKSLKQKIYSFKQRQMELELKRTQGYQVPAEEEFSLSDLYTEIMMDADGAGFIENERAVIGLLSHVFETIGAGVPVDVDYDAV